MDMAKIIPMAVVMVAGPQIISAILLATSEKARKNSLAFVAGAVSAAVIGTYLFFLITGALHDASSSNSGAPAWEDYLFIVLLSILAVRVFVKRKDTEPPKWMGKLQTATPKFTLRLGFLLFALMPTDLLTMFTVGGYLTAHDLGFTSALPFLAVTALFISSPLLVLVLMGKRADAMLPKMRDWMNSHSWVVSEVVIAFFLVMEIMDAIAA